MECFLGKGDFQGCLVNTQINTEIVNACISLTDSEYQVTEKYNDTSTWLNGRYPVFDIHKEDVEKHGVSGSPTLVINGYRVVTLRDSASLLFNVCSRFVTQPEQCSEVLSSTTPAPNFGFSTGGSEQEDMCSD